MPVLLPTNGTPIRRALDQWCDGAQRAPILVGEFEDYMLLLRFARAGHGLTSVPAMLREQFRRQIPLLTVGLANPVKAELYAISLECKIKHPAIAIVENARRILSQASAAR